MWPKTKESFKQIEECTWLGNEHGTQCPGEVCPVWSWAAISMPSLWTLNSLLFSTTTKIPFSTQHKSLHYLAAVPVKTRSYVISTMRFLHIFLGNMWGITQSIRCGRQILLYPLTDKKCDTQKLNDSVKFVQLRNRNEPRMTWI